MEFVRGILQMGTEEEKKSAAELAKKIAKMMNNTKWATNGIMALALTAILFDLFGDYQKDLSIAARGVTNEHSGKEAN